MKSVADRKKERREYLWKKASLFWAAVLAGLVAIPSLLILLYLLLPVVFGNPDYYYVLAMEDPSADLPSTVEQWRLLLLVLIIVFTVAGPGGVMLCRKKVKQAKALPYVPPVHEQLANAPAEEVLLRGSEQPPTSPDELLRAATDQQTPKEELLRATDTQ